LGATFDGFENLPLSKHLSFKRKPSVEGNGGSKLKVEVNFGNDPEKSFDVEPLVGMLLAKLKRLAKTQLAGQGQESAEVCFAFGIPPWYGPVERRALQDAAVIAGFATTGSNGKQPQVLLMETPQALARVLAKKHPVAVVQKEGTPSANHRDHLVIDVGASHVTMFACRIHPHGFAPNGQDYEILASNCDKNGGVSSIDALLYDLLKKKAQEKLPGSGPNLATPGSKAGARLLKAVERVRRLLGTMPTADVTVENIADDTDVRLMVSRSEVAEICAGIIDGFKTMLSSTIESSGVKSEEFSSVEILGGGSRMPMIHEVQRPPFLLYYF
jgi:molecular chaperone DnaK (HSP70)